MGLWGVWWWLWWVVWLGLRGVAQVLVGLGVARGGWEVGARLRDGSALRSLHRLDLDLRAWCLWLAPPGRARLASLRSLHRWLRPSSSCWTRVLEDLATTARQGSDFPAALVRALFDCLLEGGSEVAPLLLDLLDSPYFRIPRGAGYEGGLRGGWRRREVVVTAYLDRLRSFFLRSEDPVAQKAFLRILHIATYGFRWLNILSKPSYLRQTKICKHDARLVHVGYSHYKAFLRDKDFLDKVRGLLLKGDPGGLHDDLVNVYAALNRPEGVHAFEYHRDEHRAFGQLFLLRPLVPELARRWDELPDAFKDRLEDFRVCPIDNEGPEGAVELVERCLVPLTRQAHLVSLFHLRWIRRWGYCYGFGCTSPLNERLASTLRLELGRAVERVWQSEPAKARFLIDKAWVDLGLRQWALLHLPLTWATRNTAAKLWATHQGNCARSPRSVVGRGVFVGLARLLRLHCASGDATDHVSPDSLTWFLSYLRDGLVDLRGLFQSPAPQPHCSQVQDGPEELGMAWRDEGLEPVLRLLLSQEPRPRTADLRPTARGLIDAVDAFRCAHPRAFPLSKLPDEIHFPDH